MVQKRERRNILVGAVGGVAAPASPPAAVGDPGYSFGGSQLLESLLRKKDRPAAACRSCTRNRRPKRCSRSDSRRFGEKRARLQRRRTGRRDCGELFQSEGQVWRRNHELQASVRLGRVYLPRGTALIQRVAIANRDFGRAGESGKTMSMLRERAVPFQQLGKVGGEQLRIHRERDNFRLANCRSL